MTIEMFLDLLRGKVSRGFPELPLSGLLRIARLSEGTIVILISNRLLYLYK